MLLRAVTPIALGLLVGVLFLGTNLWATHAPERRLTWAIDSTDPLTVEARLTEGLQVDIDAFETSDPGAAVRTGAADFGYEGGGTPEIFFASANGDAVNDIYPLQDRGTDVAEWADGDPSGVAPGQIVLATLLAGLLTGVLARGLPRWPRLAATAVFAAGYGLIVADIAAVLDVLPKGSFIAAWVWTGAGAFAIAAATGALGRWAIGLALAVLVFGVLGYAAAGTAMPVEFQPWPFRVLGPYLPPHAVASGLIGTTYLDADVLRPALVLLGFSLVGLVGLRRRAERLTPDRVG